MRHHRRTLKGLDNERSEHHRDECNEWFGENRPRPAIHENVLDAVDTAGEKLPPHDVWLKGMIGMPDYSIT